MFRNRPFPVTTPIRRGLLVNSADQALGSGVWTKLDMDTVIELIDIEYDNINQGFVISEAGIYWVSVFARITHNTTGFRACGIALNGITNEYYGSFIASASNASRPLQVFYSVPLYLASGDLITPQIFVNTTTLNSLFLANGYRPSFSIFGFE